VIVEPVGCHIGIFDESMRFLSICRSVPFIR
jgi:hypothetical protein